MLYPWISRYWVKEERARKAKATRKVKAKAASTIEKHTTNCKTYIPILGGDFNVELGPGHGTECISVGRHTLNEGNKKR